MLHVETIIGQGNPGFCDGDDRSALLHSPEALVVDAHGSVLFVDRGNHCIRCLHIPPDLTASNAGWAVSTIAGGPTAGFADGGALRARFRAPSGLCCLSEEQGGGLLVVDHGNHAVRHITPDRGSDDLDSLVAQDSVDGDIQGRMGDSSAARPRGASVQLGTHALFAPHADIRQVHRRYAFVTSVVGRVPGAARSGKPGVKCGHQDGVGEEARLRSPFGICQLSNAHGACLLTDQGNHFVKTLISPKHIAAAQLHRLSKQSAATASADTDTDGQSNHGAGIGGMIATSEFREAAKLLLDARQRSRKLRSQKNSNPDRHPKQPIAPPPQQDRTRGRTAPTRPARKSSTAQHEPSSASTAMQATDKPSRRGGRGSYVAEEADVVLTSIAPDMAPRVMRRQSTPVTAHTDEPDARTAALATLRSLAADTASMTTSGPAPVRAKAPSRTAGQGGVIAALSVDTGETFEQRIHQSLHQAAEVAAGPRRPDREQSRSIVRGVQSRRRSRRGVSAGGISLAQPGPSVSQRSGSQQGIHEVPPPSTHRLDAAAGTHDERHFGGWLDDPDIPLSALAYPNCTTIIANPRPMSAHERLYQSAKAHSPSKRSGTANASDRSRKAIGTSPLSPAKGRDHGGQTSKQAVSWVDATPRKTAEKGHSKGAGSRGAADRRSSHGRRSSAASGAPRRPRQGGGYQSAMDLLPSAADLAIQRTPPPQRPDGGFDMSYEIVRKHHPTLAAPAAMTHNTEHPILRWGTLSGYAVKSADAGLRPQSTARSTSAKSVAPPAPPAPTAPAPVSAVLQAALGRDSRGVHVAPTTPHESTHKRHSRPEQRTPAHVGPPAVVHASHGMDPPSPWSPSWGHTSQPAQSVSLRGLMDVALPRHRVPSDFSTPRRLMSRPDNPVTPLPIDWTGTRPPTHQDRSFTRQMQPAGRAPLLSQHAPLHAPIQAPPPNAGLRHQ